MASTTFTVLTPAITGTTITQKTDVGSSETITISPSTAQSTLDAPGSLFVRCSNTSSTEAITVSIDVGTEFSDIGIGASAAIAVASSTSIIIGGQDFETARFQTSADTIVITQTGSGPTSWEAYQAPRANQ